MTVVPRSTLTCRRWVPGGIRSDAARGVIPGAAARQRHQPDHEPPRAQHAGDRWPREPHDREDGPTLSRGARAGQNLLGARRAVSLDIAQDRLRRARDDPPGVIVDEIGSRLTGPGPRERRAVAGRLTG